MSVAALAALVSAGSAQAAATVVPLGAGAIALFPHLAVSFPRSNGPDSGDIDLWVSELFVASVAARRRSAQPTRRTVGQDVRSAAGSLTP